MLRKPKFAVITVSAILLIYCVLLNFEIFLPVAYLIFSMSPLLLTWLVLTVIMDKDHQVNELNDEDEWGYQDRHRDELGTL